MTLSELLSDESVDSSKSSVTVVRLVKYFLRSSLIVYLGTEFRYHS